MIETLEVGDFLPDFSLPNQRGKVTVLSRSTRGKFIVVLFWPAWPHPDCDAVLKGLAELYADLHEVAHIFCITGQSAGTNAETAEQGAPFEFLLSDPEGRAAAAYGLEAQSAEGVTCFVGDANRRLLRVERGRDDAGFAQELRRLLEAQPHERPQQVRPFAPLLYVQGVFSPTFCRELIALFEREGSESRGVLRTSGGGLGREVLDPEVKVRRDHIVTDPTMGRRIERYVGTRVLPEIAKAFAYQVTHFEQFKIACYEAESHGHFSAHRDNVTLGSAHRRFAMSLNLNTEDYAGGELCFPEYGPQLYNPAAGDAIVFSCSLLHEARPVTRGRRFVLLAFFYGADGARILQRRGAMPPDAAASG